MNCKLLYSLCVLLAFQGYVNSQFNFQPTWSYSGDNGPSFWATTRQGEFCGGSVQSPINIETDSTVRKGLEPWVPSPSFFAATFDGPHATDIINTGLRAQINLEGDFFLSGAGLPNTFKAVGLQLKWGADNTRGSEHTLNGQQYAGEVHLVMYDSKYATLREAAGNPQGLASSAFLIEEGDDDNPFWEPVIKALEKIKYAGSRYEFEEPFPVGFLLSADFDNFYRYNGSATFPACWETVIWSVFKETIKLSREQLGALRSLSVLSEESPDGVEEPLVDNFRPVQPLNGRTVYDAYIVMPGMPEGPAEGYYSCADRCSQIDLDMSFTCQCNAVCDQYGDCCEDYKDNCLVEVCSYVHTYKNKERKQRPLETDSGDDATR